MLGSIALSAGGVAYAIHCGSASDGGRGGALAVALSFFMLFAGRGTPENAMEAVLPGNQQGDVEFEIARLRGAVTSLLDWQAKEKIYLTTSSVVGTLAWGFGDSLAALFGAR
jgi:hypothetical protein